jgi:hypothetical protein
LLHLRQVRLLLLDSLLHLGNTLFKQLHKHLTAFTVLTSAHLVPLTALRAVIFAVSGGDVDGG